MNLRQTVRHAALTLEAAGVPDSRTDAELIAAHVTGLPRMNVRLMGENELTSEQEQRFSSLLLSRAQRVPLQYLLGVQCFYGLPFQVDERVLIPRPETEELCQWGLSFLQERSAPPVLDLCTGSGAIAVTLKHECPAARVTATDLSADALALARINAAQNGAEVRFVQGDLWEAVGEETFDLILSNPPYIPSADCNGLQAEVLREPRMALDGGADGLDFYRRIARKAPRHLRSGGMIAVELGVGEAESVAELLRQAGLVDVTVRNDLCGIARMVGGFRRREEHV